MKKLILFALSFILLFSLAFACHTLAEEPYPTINVDMTDEDHTMLHGSAGFLYGISNEGVPDINTLTPLKPKVLATKGALGTEHPYGDALDVADEFFEAGGQQVQMYNSNYYGVFGVTANAYEYGEVLKTIIAPYVYNWKNSMREKYPDIDSRMVYIPINEGTPVNGVANFDEAWKIYYNAIKQADPNAVIAGPNDAVYRGHNSMYNHLKFCRDNNCLPDIVTWHELQVGCLDTMDDHIADYRSICKSLGIEEKQVVINEYADYSDCGVPGRLVNWIARLEDSEVYGCLPFWHQANNLNDLTANSNDGNGAWWVYKWYGDMSGKALKLTTQNTSFDGFYGLASIDQSKQSATVIVGGNDNSGVINLNSIAATNVFKNEKFVHVKVEASYFSGYHGSSGEPEAILEGVFPVVDGNVRIQLDNMLFSTAYRLIITKTAETKPYRTNGKHHAFYEAEDALHYGSLITERESSPIEKPRYFCSGRVRMGGFDEEGDGLRYTITVPHDGLYKLSFIYGNGVGSTRNNASTHAPKNISQALFIDGEKDVLHLPNTLFYSMEGMVDKYVNLTGGTHHIKLMYSGDGGAFHDALYISYVGAYNMDVPIYDKIFEAEAADFNTGSAAVTMRDIPLFSAGGYVTDLSVVPVEDKGGIRQVVHVPQSGLYNILFRYTAESDGEIRLFLDNTNLTFLNYLTAVNISASSDWSETYTTVFLRQGLNLIDYDMTAAGAIDYMRVIASDSDHSIVFEAEDAMGSYETAQSGETIYVTPLPGDKDAYKTDGGYIELKIDAPFDGLYKMQVFQSNNDLCGTHSYNIKIIDRYASFAINGDYLNAKRYFFPNSFSDDTFIETTIPIELVKGENTIRIYNDDSWNVLWGGSTSTPGENKLVNYTPNFDKFIITPAFVDEPLRETGYKLHISASDNGFIYADKNVAADGEVVTLTLIPKGAVSALTLNGNDILPTLKTEDNNLFTTEFTVTGDSKIIATFTPAVEGDFEPVEEDEIITLNGKRYLVASKNLYKNPHFADNSGKDMEQWYVGTNTLGHPEEASYQIPKINPDGNTENLIPITKSGYLTTGSFEKDGVNTFYYGTDNASTYLVEHMSSDWKYSAWNGNRSLLSFVPIKENTNYIFSFKAYTLSGKASIRFGAIDMDEGDNFYVPSSYATNASLNFTSSSFFDCTNGDMQNVGGNWETYSLSFNSGEGADYFLFNAYWLQMCEYLCIGDFKLYELSQTPLAEISAVDNLPALVTQKDATLNLPESVQAADENGGDVTLSIQWLNESIVDTQAPGTYIVTGRLILPEGYYCDQSYITLRVIVTENLCEITAWSSSAVSIRCYSDKDATLVIAVYQGDTLANVALVPVLLKNGETITEEIPLNISGKAKLFVIDKNSVKSLCAVKML